MVTQRRRLVEDPRTLAFGLAQQVRGIKVFAVKGRVFAHHDGAGIGQCDVGCC